MIMAEALKKEKEKKSYKKTKFLVMQCYDHRQGKNGGHCTL